MTTSRPVPLILLENSDARLLIRTKEMIPCFEAVRAERGGLFFPLSQNDVVLRKRLELSYDRCFSQYTKLSFLRSADVMDIFLVCSTEECSPVTDTEAKFLFPIESYERRFMAFTNPEVMRMASNISVNDEVKCEVTIPGIDQNAVQWMDGTVRWIGTLAPHGHGTVFGVELKNQGWGDSDGSKAGHRYFHASPRSSRFASIDQIRLKHLSNSSSIRNPHQCPPEHRAPTNTWRPLQFPNENRSEAQNITLGFPPKIQSHTPSNAMISPRGSMSNDICGHSYPAVPSHQPPSNAQMAAPQMAVKPETSSTPRQSLSQFISNTFSRNKDDPGSSARSKSPFFERPLARSGADTDQWETVGHFSIQESSSRDNSFAGNVSSNMVAQSKRKPSLAVNERIVWIDANGAVEKGTVKWVGKLGSHRNEYHAGVEFDRAIGTGTGRHQGRNLFKAKMNHASLVPVIGLIREQDLQPSSTPSSQIDLQSYSNIEDMNIPKIVERNDSSTDAVLIDISNNSPKNKSPPPPLKAPKKKLFKLGTPSSPDKSPTKFILYDEGKEEEEEAASIKALEEFVRTPSTHSFSGSSNHPSEKEASLSEWSSTNKSTPRGSQDLVPISKEGSGENSDKISSSSVHSNSTVVSIEECKFTPDTCVEVTLSGYIEPSYGVVKWVGQLPVAKGDADRKILMVGVELDENLPPDWGWPADGTYMGVKYFSCTDRRGLCVPPSELRVDHRFNTTVMSLHQFGSIDSGIVDGYTAPQSTVSEIKMVCGKHRGIQGHLNSCYLDATLYAMFAHTAAFDSLLLRPPKRSDIPEYAALTTLLSTEIVYPLRKLNYVRADHMVRLRQLLAELLPDIEGLTDNEKDPEELLGALMGRLLKSEPYVQLVSQDRVEQSHLCPLIMEMDGKGEKNMGKRTHDSSASLSKGAELHSVQKLLEQSFFTSRVKLDKIPPCLIIQVPRYGKEKIFTHIFPNAELDLTHVMLSGPRPCHLCGKIGVVECVECFLTGAESLNEVTFCSACFTKYHEGLPGDTGDHAPSSLRTSTTALKAVEKHGLPIPKVKLELVSVLCIETSHYVAFSRVGDEQSADGTGWVLFDSMADRQGAEGGYNIPQVDDCPQLERYLSAEGFEELRALCITGETEPLPRYVNRLLNDCYFCFYVWPHGKYYG